MMVVGVMIEQFLETKTSTRVKLRNIILAIEFIVSETIREV